MSIPANFMKFDSFLVMIRKVIYVSVYNAYLFWDRILLKNLAFIYARITLHYECQDYCLKNYT